MHICREYAELHFEPQGISMPFKKALSQTYIILENFCIAFWNNPFFLQFWLGCEHEGIVFTCLLV